MLGQQRDSAVQSPRFMFPRAPAGECKPQAQAWPCPLRARDKNLQLPRPWASQPPRRSGLRPATSRKRKPRGTGAGAPARAGVGRHVPGGDGGALTRRSPLRAQRGPWRRCPGPAPPRTPRAPGDGDAAHRGAAVPALAAARASSLRGGGRPALLPAAAAPGLESRPPGSATACPLPPPAAGTAVTTSTPATGGGPTTTRWGRRRAVGRGG